MISIRLLSFQILGWASADCLARSRSSRPLGLHFVQAHQPFPKGTGCLARSRSSRSAKHTLSRVSPLLGPRWHNSTFLRFFSCVPEFLISPWLPSLPTENNEEPLFSTFSPLSFKPSQPNSLQPKPLPPPYQKLRGTEILSPGCRGGSASIFCRTFLMLTKVLPPLRRMQTLV